MIFQCQDLDRALESSELMPDAIAHAENCQRCREQLRVWNEISRLAPQLHESWETPDLWRHIRSEISAAELRRNRAPAWRWAFVGAAATAAALILAAFLWHSGLNRKGLEVQASSRELLTEQALREVQQTEAAYARSIQKLSDVAGPSLDQSPTPLAAAYREKLATLDSAIADLKSAIETNRYNAYLQTQLASLYRAKQQTLQEWVKNAKRS